LLNEVYHGTSIGFLHLARKMELQDAHFSAVVRIRKHAIWGAEPQFLEKTPLDHFLTTEAFYQVWEQLLDAIVYGYSASELIGIPSNTACIF